MANSEIDDIFSGKFSKPVAPSSKAKGKSKATDVPAAPSTSSTSTRKKAKKRKRRDVNTTSAPSTSSSVLTKSKSRKSKDEDEDEDNDNDEEELEAKSRVKRPRVVETVRDPSAAVRLPPQKPPNPKTKTKSKSSKGDSMKDAMDRFKDSRGVGPRKKTEEGFLVFKEDELGIRDEGGDTPLCPFDCNCCF